jgi:hypothetical protein
VRIPLAPNKVENSLSPFDAHASRYDVVDAIYVLAPKCE